MSNVDEGMPFTFSKPVESFGDQIISVVFRPPTGEEIRRLNIPMVMSADGTQIDFHMDRVGKYAALLATPPLSPLAVNKIPPGDWLPMAAAIAPFFTPS